MYFNPLLRVFDVGLLSSIHIDWVVMGVKAGRGIVILKVLVKNYKDLKTLKLLSLKILRKGLVL